ncbi:MAG TPA: SusC/RagA family TonB-linked outer membrane protein, partial [Puia sp.]|nr:SusC/RagA family TonB-linked outer membrane protein [Puia sp.]
ATFQEDIKQSSLLTATGFLDDAMLSNISAASVISKNIDAPANNYYKQYKYNAVFARVGYDWQSKYIINFTGRRDGSSRFGPGKQFANFGAVGACWIFTNESFFRNLKSNLSFGKLRASYGTTGNDQIADYGYLNIYGTTSFPYNGVEGLYPTQLYNADYAWETNRKLELGLELGFLNDRIYFVADYFRNRSSNQLVGYPLPSVTGFRSIEANLPATVQNTGFELQLSSVNIKTRNFKWNTSFNITVPRNKLISYPGIENSPYATRYVVGKPLSVVVAFHSTGVDSATGVYQFEDVTHGGSTLNPSNPTDLRAYKEITQNYFGGLDNNFSYKGFQLDIFFQFVKQTGNLYLYNTMPGYKAMNQPTLVLTRWQNPGDNTVIQKFSQRIGGPAWNGYRNSTQSDMMIGDASFVRLKNVSISYQLSPVWLQRAHIQNCRIYMQGQNLLTITSYKGLDPEVQTRYNLPLLRVVIAGIQLTF